MRKTHDHRRRAPRGYRPLLALAALTTAALSATAVQTAAAASAGRSGSTPSGHQAAAKRVCATASAGHAACMALVRTDVQGVKADALAPNVVPAGYGPGDLRSAYNLSGTGNPGETIAIVDAYDDPNAETDMAAYRAQYGLPPCTTANGCFRKVSPGSPTGNANWGAEISLDLDMVSAIAPGAHILLVEATSANMADLGAAENQAVALGAKFVSNSWGGSESSSDSTFDTTYFNHPGVAITVSSGDGAYTAGTQYPAASQYVTAVGGTSLTRTSNARGWSESVWDTRPDEGAGSGCSGFDPKPSWQTDSGCAHRTVADVAAVADPATGVAVYDTYGNPGWQVYGGTSAASPIIASVYALAGTPGVNDRPASYPYHTTALNDVTTGANGVCTPAYLCNAGPGYDGPTGLGTPNGVTAFAPAPGPNVLKAPSFEGSTTGWQPFIPTGGSVGMTDYNTAAGAPAAAHEGSWYLGFGTNTGGGSVYQDVSVSATANSSWTATAWLAAQSGTVSGQLCVWALGPNVSSCHGYTVGTGYTQVQVVLSAPAAYSSIRFQIYPAVNGGTTDLDGTSLIPSRLTAGSFEQNNTTGWQRFVPAGGTVNMVDYNAAAGAPAIAQDGTWYLAFNTTVGGGSVYQDVPTSDAAGTTYTAIAWLSSQGGTATGSLCLWGLQPNTNTCAAYSVTAGTYTPVRVVYTTPQASPTLRLQVYAGAGTTDMDTVSLLTVS